MPDSMQTYTYPVGLEESPDGATLVHCLSVPGCVSAGADRGAALEAFAGTLAEWLHFLGSHGEPVPPRESELEITVEEWISTDLDVAEAGGVVCFDADRVPLSDAEIGVGLRRLGDLRGRLLRALRQVPDAELDRDHGGEWTVRRIVDELARAQWWTLTRLGASPLAEVPTRTLSRLDTAMALVVQKFTELPEAARANEIELDGELWTPRRVLRRLLWLEWTLGRSALHLLAPAAAPA